LKSKTLSSRKRQGGVAMNDDSVLNTPEPVFSVPVDLDRTYDVVDGEGNLVEKAVEVPANPLPRKRNVTVCLPRVIACKHRLDLSRPPRHRNCDDCWFAFFQNNPHTVETADELHQAGNSRLIEQLQGTKFLKKFRNFMSTVAKLKEQGLVVGQEGAQV